MATSLLRKLSNKDAWADVEASALWQQEDCPPEALVQVFDNRDGVSTWRVNTEDDIDRVVAAQAFMGSTIGADFAYCLIKESDLQSEGIRTETKLQKTIDKEVDGWHVNLIKISGKQLIRLAHLIHTHCKPRVKTRQEILAAALKYFDQGKFDREYFGKKDAPKSAELLVHLWKKQNIYLRSS
jgi:hypothetical protein